MRIIEKDITTVEAPAVIVHGVNCQRTMGSGVAKALYEKWGIVKEMYLTIPKENMYLGMVQYVPIKEFLTVVNCFTQEHYGHDGKKYADADAVRKCLFQVAKDAKAFGFKHLYAPRIGCHLGGLDWETDLLPIFEELQAAYPNLDITICDLPTKGE